MESLFILIPLSVLAVGIAVLVFFRMNRDGQFDDDQGPAMSVLLDDDRPRQHAVSDAMADEVKNGSEINAGDEGQGKA